MAQMVRFALSFRRPAHMVLGAVMCLYLVYLVAWLQVWPAAPLGVSLGSWAEVLVFLGSGAVAWLMSSRTAAPTAWRLFGAGTFMWGLGELVYASLGETSSRITVADPLFLAFPVCFILAFRVLNRRAVNVPSRAYQLDVAALTVTLGGYLWYFLLADQVQDTHETLLTNLVASLYPLSDLLLLGLLLGQGWRGLGRANGMWLLLLGLVVFIAADLGFTFLTLTGVYDGMQWPDALWPLAAVCFAVAAVQAARPKVAREGGAPGQWRLSWPMRLAPYVSLLASFAFALTLRDATTLAARGALISPFIVALLLAARQSLALRALEARSVELADSRAMLRHQAYHDSLTGLGNRTYLNSRLGPALQAGRPVGLAFVDLDDFKFVNDALGHRGGDELLQEVARRLQHVAGQHCADHDACCVRLGGDEFVVAFGSATAAALEALGAGLTAAMQEPVVIGGQRVRVTASVGTALSTPCVKEAETLLWQADVAMSDVKRSGKNATRAYRAEHHEQLAARRLQVENRLRGVLTRPGLSLHYQPQMEWGGRRERFEALLRWTDQELGSVSPAEFVPIAETAGMMIELDTWVIEEACRQLALWRPSFPERQVAVNISPPHLVRPDFLEHLAAALARHGVPPQALELEVTERLMVENEDQARATLQALIDLGVEVAIDDFGVGQSSLSALLSLPISTLKIDRAFVKGLGSSAPGQGDTQEQAASKVVQAIVALGQALNLRVVAEGVETESQGQLLWTLGVDALQGYWVGRPGPPEPVPGPQRLLPAPAGVDVPSLGMH